MPKNYEKRFVFCIFTLILLFGIGGYILIFDYLSLPSQEDNPDYYLGQKYVHAYMRKHGTIVDDNSRFWEVSIGNGFMSNFENIIVYVCFLWGFMRITDLFRIINRLDKQKEEEEIFYNSFPFLYN